MTFEYIMTKIHQTRIDSRTIKSGQRALFYEIVELEQWENF